MDNCATVCRQGRGEGVGASNEGAVLGAFAAGKVGAQSVGRSGKGEEDGASARRGGAGRGGRGYKRQRAAGSREHDTPQCFSQQPPETGGWCHSE